MGFPDSSVGKESTFNVGDMRDMSLFPQSGKIPWRRKMATHSSILAIKSHGQRSLQGYNPNACKQLDMTEQLLCQSLSRFRLFVIPWIIVCQATLSMEILQARIPSGLPFPSPGDLHISWTEPRSSALQANSLPFESSEKTH